MNSLLSDMSLAEVELSNRDETASWNKVSRLVKTHDSYCKIKKQFEKDLQNVLDVTKVEGDRLAKEDQELYKMLFESQASLVIRQKLLLSLLFMHQKDVEHAQEVPYNTTGKLDISFLDSASTNSEYTVKDKTPKSKYLSYMSATSLALSFLYQQGILQGFVDY